MPVFSNCFDIVELSTSDILFLPLFVMNVLFYNEKNYSFFGLIYDEAKKRGMKG